MSGSERRIIKIQYRENKENQSSNIIKQGTKMKTKHKRNKRNTNKLKIVKIMKKNNNTHKQ